MMNMIERVARAIAGADHGDGCDVMWESYLPEARAEIEAMREPTPEMIRSGVQALSRNGVDEANLDDARFCHHAMLSAALATHDGAGQDGV